MKRIVQFVVFDLVWFAAIIGREKLLWLTVALVAIMVFNARSFYWKRRKYIALLVLVGIGSEALFVLAGVISFNGFSVIGSTWLQNLFPELAQNSLELVPLWLIVLWIGFSAMVFTVFDWLQNRKLLAFVLGAIFGPVTYIAGERLGAAEFLVSDSVVIAAYALVWGGIMILVSLLISIAHRDQETTNPEPYKPER